MGTKITDSMNPLLGLLKIEVPDQKKFVPLFVPHDINIGKVKFKGCIFVRDRSLLKIAIDKPAFLTDYLNENGGIRVYRRGWVEGL